MKQLELFKVKNNKKLRKRIKEVRDNSLNGLVSNFGGPYTGDYGTPNSINQTNMLRNNQKAELISMDRNLLSYLYVNYGLVQTIVDVPVEDAFRGTIKVIGRTAEPKKDTSKDEKALRKVFNSIKKVFSNSEEKEEENKEQNNNQPQMSVQDKILLEKYEDRKRAEADAEGLEIKDKKADEAMAGEELTPFEIKRIEQYMLDNNVYETIKYAIKWGRLYGGGGVIVNCGQKPDTKLDIEKINQDTPLEFYHADMWELSGIKEGNPIGDVKVDWTLDVPFNYYGKPLHKSRVLLYKGKEAPSFIRWRLRGWGTSEIERFVRSINQFIKNNNVIYELLDEAKMDVYQVTGFNDSLQDVDGTSAITERFRLATMLKNYTNAIAIDTEDNYQQKQVSFSGLAEIANQFRLNVAADLRMPLTKIFGMSSAGFNSGDDDIENYNSMIESEIRSKAKNLIVQVLRIVARKVLGKTCDFDIEFAPLRNLAPLDSQKIKNSEFTMLLKAYYGGVISANELINAMNKNTLLGFEVKPKEKIVPDPELGKLFIRDNL